MTTRPTLVPAIMALGLAAGSNAALAQDGACTTYPETERWLLEGGGFTSRYLRMTALNALPHSSHVEVRLSVDYEDAVAEGGYYDFAVGGWPGIYDLSRGDERGEYERYRVDGKLRCCISVWRDPETGKFCTELVIRGVIDHAEQNPVVQ